MQPIIAFKLPVLLSKPLLNQLLTLYLIRSNPDKEPYDPNYANRARKRSKVLPELSRSIGKSKLSKEKSKSKSKQSSNIKDETIKFKLEKFKKSKSKTKTTLESKNVSKSSIQPVTSTPHSKIPNKSRSVSLIAGDDKSSSQVLSVPSTSKAISTQCKNNTKTTSSKKKNSDGHSSSSKTSVLGTPLTSKSDSRTPLKSNQLNYAPPSPPEVKPSKLPSKISVPEKFRHFKIPKKPREAAVDEKHIIPKRLQPSGNSPVDLIIGTSSSFSSTTQPNEPTQCRKSQNLDEDFGALEESEPELGFDLYGVEISKYQALEDFCGENNESTVKEDEEEEVEDPNSIECQDYPMNQSSLPSQSVLKQFDDESESSDDEGNFKRRGVKERSNDEPEVTFRQEKDQIIPPLDTPTPTQSVSRSRSIPINTNQLTSKVISLRPTPSSSRPPIPATLSPHRHSSSSSPRPPAPSQPSVFSSGLNVQSVISSILHIKSPEEAMKEFLKSLDLYPQIIAVAIPKFQNLFTNLLLNLFRDVNFIWNRKKFEVLLKIMRQLGMDDSLNWEGIICSWGQNYQSLLSNQAKLENLVIVVTHIYDHLQANNILINLPTAGLLYEMKMVQNESDH